MMEHIGRTWLELLVAHQNAVHLCESDRACRLRAAMQTLEMEFPQAVAAERAAIQGLLK